MDNIAAGGAVDISAGSGHNGPGGSLLLTSGAQVGNGHGPGGHFECGALPESERGVGSSAGAASKWCGSGNVTIASGSAAAAEASGAVLVASGAAKVGAAGDITLRVGTSGGGGGGGAVDRNGERRVKGGSVKVIGGAMQASNGAGGDVRVTSGEGGSGAGGGSGDVLVSSAAARHAVAPSGKVVLSSGNSSSGRAGDVHVASGAGQFGGGDVRISGGVATGDSNGRDRSGGGSGVSSGGTVALSAGDGLTPAAHGGDVLLRAGLGKAGQRNEADIAKSYEQLTLARESFAVSRWEGRRDDASGYGFQDGTVALVAANGERRVVANTSSVAVAALRVVVGADSTAA